MGTKISHLAQVDLRAEIDHDVEIGPFCVVGPHVRLGAGTRLDSHVVITGHTTVGKRNRFFPNSVVGTEPQDYSYSGAPTYVEIGDDNIFREGVTVHRGAEKEDGTTRVGNNCMVMANGHIAHNCQVGHHVVIVNGVLLGGHVHVHDYATISGNVVVHHFSSVGTCAFIAGGARVVTDVPPYMMSHGNDNNRVAAVNVVGLQRRGISEESIKLIKKAHKLLFREHRGLATAKAELLAECPNGLPTELTLLLDFIAYQNAGKHGRGGEQRRALPSPYDTPAVPAPTHVPEQIRRAA